MKMTFAALMTTLTAASALAVSQPAITGDYLEVRSCDIFTGPCFANAEMGLTGKEAIMVWSVKEGSWQGTALDGLSVIAVVRANATLGDVKYEPRNGRAMLIVDEKASPSQQAALQAFAKSMAGSLVKEVAAVKTSSIEAKLGSCTKSGCSTVKAGNLVNISTRCFSDDDHVCGNEDIFYSPLIDVTGALPAYTEIAAFNGKGLDATWQLTGRRSAYLASFSR
ncbi:MAG TPA: DUF1326 domain-containing protein [Candidatus Binatia bacterium]|nr:DUF1326 domain-containing protein [Candidatus Binatia bacterium]